MALIDSPAPIETPILPPPTSTPEPTEPAGDDSIAAHETAFGKNGTGIAPIVEEAGPIDPSTQRPRHRAKSQQARAEDVPRIAELTKRLREREAELEALRAKPAAPSPPVSAPRPAVPAVTPVAGAPFTEKEPVFTDFQGEPDPYLAYTRAVAKYDRRKDAWESDQQARHQAAETARQAQVQEWGQRVQAHTTRLQTFAASTPDFQTIAGPLLDRQLPNALLAAIIADDKGPQFVYALGKDPDLLDDMILASDGRTPSDEFVALLRRRLTARLQAASTGSAVASIPPHTARPPNPVRTGPMQTGTDLPDDASSLAAHEKAFSSKKHR